MKTGKVINLGRTNKELYGHLDPPVAYGAGGEAAAEEEEDNKIHYPSFYLSDRPGLKAHDFPNVGDEGEAIIKFRIASKTISEREDKTSCSVDIEVRSVQFKADDRAPAKNSSDDEDAIESGLSDVEKKSKGG